MHSIHAWEEAVRESQARAVDKRAKEARRRLYRKMALAAIVLALVGISILILL